MNPATGIPIAHETKGTRHAQSHHCSADYPVAPELHRFSYDRAGSTVTEVEGASHFLMLSQPDIVASVIREAVIASAVNRAA
jgi:pimeloyl-ACP methyl ester carboxylesterase